MADNSKGYNLSFFFDTADSVSEAKRASQAMAGLDRQIKHLERSEKQFDKAQAEVNRRLKAGNITSKQHSHLMRQLGVAYKKQTGDSSKLTRELRRQREEQDRLNRSKERGNRLGNMVGSGLASRAGALGALGAGGVAAGLGLGAVAGLGAFAKQQYERQRLLEREAELLGLSARGLEGVSSAMAKLGATSKDEAIDGLKDIRERIGEIADDAEGSLGKAARSIGLDAQRLRGMDVSGQIEAIVGSLSKLDTEARLFRSRELFGDSAANLLTGAAGDTQKFKELQAEGEKNAVLLSKSSMESMERLNRVTEQLKAKVAEPMAKAAELILDAANLFLDAAPKTKEGARELSETKDRMKSFGIETDRTVGNRVMSELLKASGLHSGGQIDDPESKIGDLNNLLDITTSPAFTGGLAGLGLRAANYAFAGDGKPSLQLQALGMVPGIDENMQKILKGKSDELKDKYSFAFTGDSKEGDKGSSSAGSSSPASTALSGSSPMDFYVQQEKARRDALERQGWLDTYKQQQPRRSDAQLNRMADMEMQFAKEREGVNVGSKLKELTEAQRKYFFNELKRIETLEKAAKIEKDRIKSLREEESAAKAAFDANIKKAEAERQAAFGKLDAQDNKISGDADLLRLRANGASQGGANFSGGSVEEFQYVSEMNKENEVKEALFAIDKMEQERHERVQKKREEIQQDAQEQMENLRSDLTDLLSQIREKIAISGTN